MNEIFLILFGILFISVFVWFYMCSRLFTALKTRHPETYVSMGEPSLFLNNTIKSNFLFLKYLLKREWRVLNDDDLASLSSKMLVFLFAYLVGFAFLSVGIQYVSST